MFARLVGGSTVTQLKEGLDASSRAVRAIADRVANASDPSFSRALDSAGGSGANGANGANGASGASGAGTGSAVDLQQEMVSLADEQLRFEATANLLQKVYQQIRSSVRER